MNLTKPCFQLLVTSILFLVSTQLWAQETTNQWNRFRGPNGDGVVSESNIPAEFGPDKNVVWKTNLPKGYSSPVFHDGKIFLTAEEDEKLLTLCIGQSDGKQLWRKTAPRARTERLDPRNHPAAPSPVVDRNDVFVFFPDFGMVGYQVDGTEKWKTPLGPFTNVYGMGASPLVVDDLVVLVCDQNLDSYVIALNRDSGQEVWKTPREEATSGHCSPVLYQPDPMKPAQIIVAGSFNLTSYDSASGKKLWWVGGLCFEMKSTPVIAKDVAYINGFGSPENEIDKKFDIDPFEKVIASHDADKDGSLVVAEMPDEMAKNAFVFVDLDANGSLNEKEWTYFRNSMASKNSMMAIRLGGSGDMTTQNTVWKYHKNIPQLPSPLLIDNQLLMVNDRGILTVLDPETGKEQFKGRISGASGNYYASPVAAGDKVIFATTSGKVAVVKAGQIGADGELNVLAVNELEDGVYATPAVVGNHLFIRTDSTLYCFGKSN